jgi:GMP synthase (glutamine-hydrolysing)
MEFSSNKEAICVLDFGGQYAQLIARRVRDLKVYCEIRNFKEKPEELKKYKGIIFTGGPNSVYASDSPKCSSEVFNLGIPVLGICYGAQLIAYMLGGRVENARVNEYGNTPVDFTESDLCSGIENSVCWMSHTDYISALPDGFICTAKSKYCPAAAIENIERKLYGVQFHPEVEHTKCGNQILSNFLYNICKCEGKWEMSSFTQSAVDHIKKTVGEGKVICGLSGGVDSSVAALLVHKAIGSKLTCIFVDHGMLRKDEASIVGDVFKNEYKMNIIMVDAKDRFLSKLKGVTDPEQKRHIIGEEFIRVFEEESTKLGGADYLCQGTIYPDVVESGTGEAAKIKSHHNVGGLPKNIQFKGLVEPLRDLFKDEVRRVGIELGLSEKIVWRQPFPGPGLAVRIIGEITDEKLELLKEADAIFREEIAIYGLEKKVGQYFAVLPGVRSVGVMGDGRSYNETIALRAVITSDFMTADWAQLPYELLGKVSNRIINEVKGVNRVVYDITSKPPSTIEWE